MDKSNFMELGQVLIGKLVVFLNSISHFIVESIEDDKIHPSSSSNELMNTKKPAKTEYEATVNHEYGSIYYPDD